MYILTWDTFLKQTKIKKESNKIKEKQNINLDSNEEIYPYLSLGKMVFGSVILCNT